MLPSNVELKIVKVFGDNCNWVYASSLAVAMQRCRELGAKIISMSLGGGASSTTEESQVNIAYNSGMLLFAAAGNDGNGVTSYPAGYGNVISVAAIDEATVKAGFSQFNADVELSAPGVAVLSTVYAMAAITSPAANTWGDWMDGSVRTNVSTLASRCTTSSSTSTTTCPLSASGKHCSYTGLQYSRVQCASVWVCCGVQYLACMPIYMRHVLLLFCADSSATLSSSGMR